VLPLQHRLKHTSDVALVRKQGQSWRHPLLILLVRANGQEISRFAFVASRFVGKAVVRNRAKRLLREVVRHYLPYMATGWDCLLIARVGLSQASLEEVNAAVVQLLTRAHLLQENSD
jgi:ribonuclease P protein component